MAIFKANLGLPRFASPHQFLPVLASDQKLLGKWQGFIYRLHALLPLGMQASIFGACPKPG